MMLRHNNWNKKRVMLKEQKSLRALPAKLNFICDKTYNKCCYHNANKKSACAERL